MALTLYLARHAEAHNPRRILYGRLPRIDLSEQGRRQAAALAEALAGLRLDAIYSSPLLRARRTADAIAAFHSGVPRYQSRLLLENRHPWEGRTHAELGNVGDRAYDPEVLGEVGETIADLRDRLARFMHRTLLRHPDGAVLAVAHADPLAALRAHLLGKTLVAASLREEAPPLASVFSVELDAAGPGRVEWFWRPPAPPPQAAAESSVGGRPADGQQAAGARNGSSPDGG